MKVLAIFLVFFVAAFLFLFVGKAPQAKEIAWGVNFSQKEAEYLGLDWKTTYLALLEDLGTKDIRIAAHWDQLEPTDQNLSFENLDWQMDQAAEHGTRVLLAVGMKTPRWPECHIPEWAKSFSTGELKEEVLGMLSAVVERYKNHPALFAWQVENEPLFPFGPCPFRNYSFLQREIELVQSLDSSHPVFASDSGELSLWLNMARLGDKVIVTMYQKAWSWQLNTYLDYPLPPVFYYRKALVIEKVYGKEVVVGELQAEPWTPNGIMNDAFEEQEKTMNATQFQTNIAFAKATGLSRFYLWGAEWWYWLKTEHDDARIFDEAKKLFVADETL